MAITLPANITTLNPNGFYFQIQKYPEINYFLQDVNLPDLTLGTALMNTSVHDIKTPGDTMEFGALNVTYLIDSKMENYLAIHDWMVGLGFPEQHKEFTDYLANPKNVNSYYTSEKTVSDCVLTILDGNNLPIKSFTFVDAFPVSLSGVQLTATNPDVTYITATVTLEYSYYRVN